MDREQRRQTAGRQVVAKVLADEIKGIGGATRKALEPELEPGEATTAALPDGTVIGRVSVSKVRETATVTDERALLEWVRENRPEELVESVRESTLKAWKEQCARDGHAHTPDGEVIPGIELVNGSASYLPQPSDEGRAIVAARLRAFLAGEQTAIGNDTMKVTA